jgi:membrane fusion protein (multidrug efflux system)
MNQNAGTQIEAPSTERTTTSTRSRWLFPALRVLLVLAAGVGVWYVAGHWNRWTGAARYQSTDDAYLAGDLTPLAAKVSGYIVAVPVNDYQAVHRGDLIVQIDPSDYTAQLAQAQANLAAARDAGQSLQPEGRATRADPPG